MNHKYFRLKPNGATTVLKERKVSKEEAIARTRFLEFIAKYAEEEYSFHPSPDFKIEGFKTLYKKTDLLGNYFSYQKGFFVTERLKEILERYEVSSHDYIPTTLHPIKIYFCLYFHYGYENIDFSKNISFKFEDEDKVYNSQDYDLLSRDKFINFQFEKKEIDGRLMDFETISLINNELDLFSLNNIRNEFFLSERLALELKRQKISGFQLSPSKINFI